jgi:zinc transporter ZupT
MLSKALFFILILVSCTTQSSIDDIIQLYDANNDSKLQDVEFNEYYFTMFPILNDSSVNLTQLNIEHCYANDALFLDYDVDGDDALDSIELENVSISLIRMLLNECDKQIEKTCNPKRNVVQSWIYGILSSVILSLLSLIGVFTIPVKGKNRQVLMIGLVSLAFGTLLGDAFLHIVPQIYGAHSHSSDGQTADNTHHHELESLAERLKDDFIQSTGPGIVIVISILVFYLIEYVFSQFLGLEHHHDDGEESEHDEMLEKKIKEKNQKKPLGYVVLLSDCIHNCIDGLAIGVAYAASPLIGLATTIAIILHEIPHELGNFAILIFCGFTKKKALLFNLVASLTSIVGCIIGLAVGSEIEKGENWILCVVVGSFLYISLGDLLPEITNKKGYILVKGICILLGLLSMVIIAIIETSQEGICVGE